MKKYLLITLAVALIAALTTVILLVTPAAIWKNVLDFFNGIPAVFWSQLIDVFMQIVLPAIIVSPVALAVKKWWHIHSEKIMIVVVMAGSLISAAVLYAAQIPEIALPVQAALTFATTQPVYYFLIKPLYERVARWFAKQVEEAAKLNDAKSAAVPAEGLPIGSPKVD